MAVPGPGVGRRDRSCRRRGPRPDPRYGCPAGRRAARPRRPGAGRGEILTSVGVDRGLHLTRWRTIIEGPASVDLGRGGGPRPYNVTAPAARARPVRRWALSHGRDRDRLLHRVRRDRAGADRRRLRIDGEHPTAVAGTRPRAPGTPAGRHALIGLWGSSGGFHDVERAVNVVRFRVAWIMVLVAIAALNFGAIRAWSDLRIGHALGVNGRKRIILTIHMMNWALVLCQWRTSW